MNSISCLGLLSWTDGNYQMSLEICSPLTDWFLGDSSQIHYFTCISHSSLYIIILTCFYHSKSVWNKSNNGKKNILLKMLIGEHLCSFANTVRVDDATNKRERIMGKYTFPLKSMPLFLQENGYSSLKNVLKMYQRWKIMNICTRFVRVQFWKLSCGNIIYCSQTEGWEGRQCVSCCRSMFNYKNALY